MDRPNRAAIHGAMQAKGYRVFENARGFDLNIIGVRSNERRANHFDDWMTVSYREVCAATGPSTPGPAPRIRGFTICKTR